MPNRLMLGHESQPVARGHGKSGNVVLRVDITPELKDALVALAQSEGATLKAVVVAALRNHVRGRAA